MRHELVDEKEFCIKPGFTLQGAQMCLENALRLAKGGNRLFAAKMYQTSIPMHVLTIEESLKALFLLVKYAQNKDVSRKEWKSFTFHEEKIIYDHKHKLDNVDKCEKIQTDEARKIYKMIYKESIKSRLEYNEIKKKCFYTDWDNNTNTWMNFELDVKYKRKMALRIKNEARETYNWSCKVFYTECDGAYM